MQNHEKLSEHDLSVIVGGTNYYGNGVYCNSKKCWVDWSKATQSIIGIGIKGWSSGLAGMGH